MIEPKKLIEVAMPIKEISAECGRDKSIRHGHISTLHIWWARRPLPVCRAVVFASLVPDPDDENCPIQFKEAVALLLGEKSDINNHYIPYNDIPYTSAIDKMDDNLRNRLLMFIGKFSDRYILNLKHGKVTDSKDELSDYSLIKWENRSNNSILIIARKLIWVSHNWKSNKSTNELLLEFDKYFGSIKYAEDELYKILNRHIETPEVIIKKTNLSNAINDFLKKMPIVFDPFAGGGAIPLETARLGCRSFGNDINPVAHIIQKGGVEFPQKFGKPYHIDISNFEKIYGKDALFTIPNEWKQYSKNAEWSSIIIPNRLSFDVDFYAKKILNSAFKKISKEYDDNGQIDLKKVIGYYWIHSATCSNPTCRASVPLIRTFYLSNKANKKIFLKPIISGKDISFIITNGVCEEEPWIQRKNLKCPICNNITNIKELKKQFNDKKTNSSVVAVIEDSVDGKCYREPTSFEKTINSEFDYLSIKPNEKLPVGNSRDLHCTGWGILSWGDMFNPRQLKVLDAIINELNELKLELKLELEYKKSIVIYLGLLIDKIAAMSTSLGLWKDTLEAVVTPFGRQAIPFVFDYPEVNIFSNSTGSALNQLDWIKRYIESESKNEFYSVVNNASSGEKNQFAEKSLTAVITDPPYYDAIAYADLSDFFYVWMKRSLMDILPEVFVTPQTPKSDECTALKHHQGTELEAKVHFENKLLEIFDAIEIQTKDIVSIMFAHQSTEAWTTLCNSILNSRMNITGSWAIDSEREVRGIALAGAALASSVTVSAKPSKRFGLGEYKVVKNAIEIKVAEEVKYLYKMGFRGADLLTACFGQAVSEFGKYEKVEKGDGTEVTVSDLLELARECAFNALLQGFDGDDFTKFYIGWLQLNGFSETNYDDAAKFVKVGLSINVNEFFKEHILIKNGNMQHLASLKDRIAKNTKIGEEKNSSLINKTHRLMFLYSGSNRNSLLNYIETNAFQSESSVWRVLTSLVELLPKDFEDHKLAIGLLANKDQLIREAKTSNIPKPEQSQLTFE